MKFSILLYLLTIFFPIDIGSSEVQLDSMKYTTSAYTIIKIFVDQLGNIYCITDDHIIIKISNNGDTEFVYANTLAGNINHLDVSNPQKILAFSAEFGIIIILDNTLSILSQINISRFDFFGTNVVAMANDGNFWIYDHLNVRLVKIDKFGNILIESNSLLDFNINGDAAQYMVENDNQIYILKSSSEVLVFDNFGNYIRNFIVSATSKILVLENKIFYISDGQLKYTDLTTFEEYDIAVEPNEIGPYDDFSIHLHTIFVIVAGAMHTLGLK